MKKAILIFSILIFGFVTTFAQQHKKQLTIIVDSIDVVKFLSIFQVGYSSLLDTQLPGTTIKQYQIYGDSLLRFYAAIYQSWQPRVEVKKDTSKIK